MEKVGLSKNKALKMHKQFNSGFWQGKRVFLTGHTGFKGGWAALWLQHMGAQVKGFALNPPSTPSLFECAKVASGMQSDIGDIRDRDAIANSMRVFNPDILIHMAAQPLVRLSYREPVETYATNVMGTLHVFEAARQCPNLRAIVNITTDKCYENREWEWGYRENEPMGGHDPYSNSKGCAELVTSAYRKSFFSAPGTPSLASVRAGNVIGGGDWAEDRLIPDILNAFENKQPVVIRNPQATRPWQHVLEPLNGYLILAEAVYSKPREFSEAFNFGPEESDVQSVEWIVQRLCAQIEGSKYQIQPATLHEAQCLKLDSSKAKSKLSWRPKLDLTQALDLTLEWHKAWRRGEDMQSVTLQQVRAYASI